MATSHTLILIKTDRFARADFNVSAPKSLVAFAEAPRRPGMGLGELTEAALDLGTGCGGKVFVLCEDLWTSVLSLPATAIAGLDADALARAIAFEAEPLAGIPALDAVAGFAPLGKTNAGQNFWTTVIPAYERDRIQAVIKKAGGKLGGILHPGGVPVPLMADAKVYRRSEIWSQVSISADSTGKSPRVQIFGAGAGGANRATNSTSSWRLSAVSDITETLLGRPAGANKDATQGTIFSLETEKDLQRFLAAWAQALVKPQDAGVPLVSAKVFPVSTATLAAAGILLELVVLAGCYFHYVTNTGKIADARKIAVEAKASVDQVTTLNKKADELKAETVKLIAERKRKDDANTALSQDMDLQRTRLATLLTELSAARPDDVVIESIKSEGGGRVLVGGLSLDAAQADELASRLSERVKSLHLEVVPVIKQKAQPVEGSPWNFVLMVQHSEKQQNTATQPAKHLAATPVGGSNE